MAMASAMAMGMDMVIGGPIGWGKKRDRKGLLTRTQPVALVHGFRSPRSSCLTIVSTSPRVQAVLRRGIQKTPLEGLRAGLSYGSNLHLGDTPFL